MVELVNGSSCPVCGEGLENNDDSSCHHQLPQDTFDEVVKCPRCHTPHHKECWEYNDGCAIYGCKGAMTTVVDSHIAFGDLDNSDSLICESDNVLEIFDDDSTSLTVFDRAKVHALEFVDFLLLLQAVHWYTIGISMTVSSLLLLSRFMYPLGDNRVVRTIAFHCLLIGFLITILARFLPSFLQHFKPKKPVESLRLPTDYTPEEIDLLISDSTKNVNTLEYAGCLHMSQHNFDRARDIFQKAIELDSEHQNCLFQLGRCFDKLGKYEIALATFEDAWKINEISGIGEKARWWADLVEKKIDKVDVF